MTLPATEPRRRLPPWLKVPLGGGEKFAHLKGLVRDLHPLTDS